MDIKYSIAFLCMIIVVLSGCSGAKFQQSNDQFQYAPGKGPDSLVATSENIEEKDSSQDKVTPIVSTLPEVDKDSLPKKEINQITIQLTSGDGFIIYRKNSRSDG